MCAIAGIVANNPVNQELYDALTVLQHRGQDAAGIMTSDDSAHLHMRKDNGLVRDVFRNSHMQQLDGNMGIGHCRYPTAGCDSAAEAQPFFVNSPYGISLAHNGNIVNAEALRTELFENDHRHINTTSDSEVLLNILAHGLQKAKKIKIEPADIFTAVDELHNRVSGGYAVVAMIAGYGIIGFRDTNGIRPIGYGERTVDGKKEYIIVSESVAADVLGFDFVRDLHPGETIFIDKNGELHTKEFEGKTTLNPCLFEYVYLARPDSVIDNVSVYEARLNMGDRLAQKIKREWPDVEIDVVIPIPDGGRTSGLQVAASLGIEYQEGFVKNRYIGRTFIMPNQEARKKSVRQKLNVMEAEFEDRNVLLVDDSIVRGNTSKGIIDMARKAGAKKIYYGFVAPAVRFPNVYGIDMPTKEELIANGKTTEEIAEWIGADRIIFQDVDDLKLSILELNSKLDGVEASCFDGNYITGDIDDAYLQSIKDRRADAGSKNPSSLDMHSS